MKSINFKLLCTVIYSFLLSTSLFYTSKINSLKASNSLKDSNFYIIDKSDFIQIIQYFLPVFIIIFISLFLFNYIKITNTSFSNFSTIKITILLFIAWIPYLLAFFPCIGAADTYYILRNMIGISVQHPFFYNLFIGIPSKVSLFLFNTMTYGLFFSTLIQMLFMSYSISYMIVWINNKLKNRYIVYILVLYFAITPIIIDYSITAIKDTIFSVTIMLWIPLLYEIFVDNRNIFDTKANKFNFCVLAFLTMAMRNNGKFIFIIILFFLMYKCIKERKQLLKYGISLLIICSLPNFVLSNFFNKPQLFQEAVAIPIQQLARTVTLNGKLNNESKDYLNKIIPLEKLKKSYDPFRVDPIKWNKNFNRNYLQKSKQNFIKTWGKEFWNNKRIYLDAWTLQTYACWANSTPTWGSQSKFGLSMTDDVLKSKKPPNHSKLKVSSINLPKQFKEILGNHLFKHSDYINPGNCFWILSYIALLLISKNKHSELIVLLPIFLCWVSLMLAVPLSTAYRYAFIYPLCLPFLVFIPFIIKERKENVNV